MLEQKYLNVDVRNEDYIELLMFVQDKNIVITNVQANNISDYSDITSIIDLDRYTSSTMATLENNEWLLNGAFFNPTEGVRYNGYMSDIMSDGNGDFDTNPKITLTLNKRHNVEYFSMILNPALKSGYPKSIITTFLDDDDDVVSEITTNVSELDTLPNIVLEVNKSGVNKVEIEFIGTAVPYRRIRLSTAMFGKVITINQDMLSKADYLDKSSYVADTIPSRTFSFDMINYNKIYNVDNPTNEIPELDTRTEVMMRYGYNIAGYNEQTKQMQRNYGATDIQWTNFKHLRLIGVSTSDDGIATFECGSLLDTMTKLYTQEIFRENRTVREIATNLLDFSGVSNDTIIYDGDFGDCIVNVPMPELPVRELIQLLAFTCGATIVLQDDGKIRFANLDLSNPQIKTSFTFDDFTAEPRAEQLQYTTDVALPRYETKITGSHSDSVTSAEVQTNEYDIEYPPTFGPSARITSGGGTIQQASLFTSHGYLVMSIPEGSICTLQIYGQKLETTQLLPRSVTKNTLLVDTKLLKNDTNGNILAKCKKWYGKKFKYVIGTRGEPLINATDFITIQTPFSDKINAYVLSNHWTYNDSTMGDMEVVSL